MREKLQEILANLWEQATPLAEESLARLKQSTKSVRTYVCSIVGRMTVKERLLVLFAFGLVIGFGIKTTSSGSITIGYQDYTLKGSSGAYDLNAIERKVAEKNAATASGMVDPTATPSGGSCQ
jgi:hypothetical protein